jgi:hypothetical protein
VEKVIVICLESSDRSINLSKSQHEYILQEIQKWLDG